MPRNSDPPEGVIDGTRPTTSLGKRANAAPGHPHALPHPAPPLVFTPTKPKLCSLRLVQRTRAEGRTAMSPTTLTIAGPQNDDIVGILEKKTPNPLPGTKIIVLLHGHAYPLLLLSCSSSLPLFLCTQLIGYGSGHKNYCYHRQLAEKSPFDSFRFDFRGNGDSGRSIHAVRTLKVFRLSQMTVVDRAGRHG
jgi:hypothetical protein